MKTRKNLFRRMIVLLLIFSLLISYREPAFVQAEESTEVSAETSEDVVAEPLTFLCNSNIKEMPYYWESSVDGDTLTLNLAVKPAATAGKDEEWFVDFYYEPYLDTYETKYFDENGACSFSYDYSTLVSEGDGNHAASFEIYCTVNGEKSLKYDDSFIFFKENGIMQFKYDTTGDSKKFIDYCNEHFRPEDNIGASSYSQLFSIENYDGIFDKTQELIADCETDLDKIIAIYDWICTNIAYDFEALSNGDISNQNQEGWVFENRRAVCGGFTSLSLLMCHMADIPSIYVAGDAGGEHSWNVIYYEDSWHYFDFTWDSENRWYGEGDERNVLGQEPSYDNFAIPPEMFGTSHKVDWESMFYNWENNVPSQEADGIEVLIGKTIYAKGVDTALEYTLHYSIKDSDAYWRAGDNLGTCTGYDLNQLGEQTVTIFYRGFTTTLDIMVVEPDTEIGITATTTKTTYSAVDTFSKEDLVVEVQKADGTSYAVTDYTVDTSSLNLNQLGVQKITVKYKEFTTTVDIEVIRVMTSISAEKKTTTYTMGKSVDIDDITATAHYSDGTTEKISPDSISLSGIDSNIAGNYSMIIGYKGLECEIPITYNPHIVTFDAYGGTDLSESSIAINEHKGKISKLPTVTRSGYRFLGWFTKSYYGTQVTEATEITSSMTLYAHWEKENSTSTDGASSNKEDSTSSKLTSIADATVTLSGRSFAYNANEIKPPVKSVVVDKVTLKEGTDYTVAYTNNRDIGKATVTITGKGSYKDEVTASFDIVPKVGTSFMVGAYNYKFTSTSEVAFAGVNDNSVKKVTIAKTVIIGGKSFLITSIESRALYLQKQVKKVTIGANVETIGYSAFEGCKKLTTIKINSKNLTRVDGNAFKGIKKNAKIKVPAKKLKVYKKLLKGKGQGKKVKITK